MYEIGRVGSGASPPGGWEGEKKGKKRGERMKERKKRREEREYGGGRMGMGKSERLMVDGVETDRTGTLYGARAHPVGPLPFFIIF